MRISGERRHSERRRVLYAGEIVVAGNETPVSMECTIRSISCSGAALRAPAAAPRTFGLKIVRDGSMRQAQTVWAVRDLRGVVFLGEPGQDRPPPMSPMDMRRLLRIVKSD